MLMDSRDVLIYYQRLGSGTSQSAMHWSVAVIVSGRNAGIFMEIWYMYTINEHKEKQI